MIISKYLIHSKELLNDINKYHYILFIFNHTHYILCE